MRPKEIDDAIDSHYKSNKGRRWCAATFNTISGRGVELYIPDGNERLTPKQVSVFIFRTFPEIQLCWFPGLLFTRETLRRVGYGLKFKVAKK